MHHWPTRDRNQAGNSYLLYQVWTAGYTLGREFPMSKAQVQITKNNSKPELVIVAANISH